MSNADRLDAAYRRYAAKKRAASKDEFLGLQLAGKVNIDHDEDEADGAREDTRAAPAS